MLQPKVPAVPMFCRIFFVDNGIVLGAGGAVDASAGGTVNPKSSGESESPAVCQDIVVIYDIHEDFLLASGAEPDSSVWTDWSRHSRMLCCHPRMRCGPVLLCLMRYLPQSQLQFPYRKRLE